MSHPPYTCVLVQSCESGNALHDAAFKLELFPHSLAIDYRAAGSGTHITMPPLSERPVPLALAFNYRVAGLGTHYAMPIIRRSYLRTTLVFLNRVAGLGKQHTMPL